MKRIILFVFISLMTMPILAHENLQTISVLDSLNNTVYRLQQENTEMARANASLQKRILSLEVIIRDLQRETKEQSKRLSDSETHSTNADNTIRIVKNDINNLIKHNDFVESNLINSTKKISTQSIIVSIIVLALTTMLSVSLYKRLKDKICTMRDKALNLSEEIIIRISSEIEEMQKISNSISLHSSERKVQQESQDLVKLLADKITFMEMTLYRMDSSIRGHKQLTRSIRQMKDNLLANGYEIVDMLGKPYHDGMKVTANFIEDNNLGEGQQVISDIIKPQINHNGQMIQAAQITVSQNI